MAEPNAQLRAVRLGLRYSQDDLARAIREAGDRADEPNGCTKRHVQRWEAGQVLSPRPIYARALQAVTGLPIEALGFSMNHPADRVSDDGQGGHDLSPSPMGVEEAQSAPTVPQRYNGAYSGVWLSRYEYFSSGRQETFSHAHFVVLLQHGDRLSVRSLPGSATSALTLDLAVDRNIVTGTWVEQTSSEGYYQGARYHGAIQLLVEPTGRRMSGKWVGFGKEFDVNTGPWELVWQSGQTDKATVDRFNRFPDA